MSSSSNFSDWWELMFIFFMNTDIFLCFFNLLSQITVIIIMFFEWPSLYICPWRQTSIKNTHIMLGYRRIHSLMPWIRQLLLLCLSRFELVFGDLDLHLLADLPWVLERLILLGGWGRSDWCWSIRSSFFVVLDFTAIHRVVFRTVWLISMVG